MGGRGGGRGLEKRRGVGGERERCREGEKQQSKVNLGGWVV